MTSRATVAAALVTATVAGAVLVLGLVVDVMRDRTIRVMASERYGELFQSAVALFFGTNGECLWCTIGSYHSSSPLKSNLPPFRPHHQMSMQPNYYDLVLDASDRGRGR
jgi:hypothetical protein